MPNYSREGKIQTPLTHEDFLWRMDKGYFVKPNHKAYIALLYYTGVRKTEALRAVREQFQVKGDQLIFSVGKRLKHGIETAPLNIPLEAAHAQDILKAIKETKPAQRVFKFSPKTAYNVVNRVFKYPHLFRLSRITNFFLEGYSIAEVHAWTGLTLDALDHYVGLVSVANMGKSLAKKTRQK